MQSETPQTQRSQPRRLWVVWLLFFFQFAAIGAFYTYLNVYYLEAGLTGTQIGLINMSTALVSVASAVGWGYLSDRTGQNRLLIAIGAVGVLAAVQFTPLLHTFEDFLLLAALGSILGSAPNTLVDSTALSLLGDRREDYGKYRLGGSFGYIGTTFAAGFFFQRFGMEMMFPVYGVIMAMFAGVALLLPQIAIHKTKDGGRGEIGQMIRRPAWLLFAVCVFLIWIATHASIMFLPVSLKAMGAAQSLIGTITTIPAVVEIPFMIFSGSLLRRFGSTRLLMIAMLLMVSRYFLLGFMPVPEWALGINLINGPAFVFFWNSAVNYAYRMAPPGMAGTAQGLLSSTTSLAGVASSLISGLLFDYLGPNGIFVVMGFFCLVALLLFGVGSLFWRPSKVTEVSRPV